MLYVNNQSHQVYEDFHGKLLLYSTNWICFRMHPLCIHIVMLGTMLKCNLSIVKNIVYKIFIVFSVRSKNTLENDQL